MWSKDGKPESSLLPPPEDDVNRFCATLVGASEIRRLLFKFMAKHKLAHAQWCTWRDPYQRRISNTSPNVKHNKVQTTKQWCTWRDPYQRRISNTSPNVKHNKVQTTKHTHTHTTPTVTNHNYYTQGIESIEFKLKHSRSMRLSCYHLNHKRWNFQVWNFSQPIWMMHSEAQTHTHSYSEHTTRR